MDTFGDKTMKKILMTLLTVIAFIGSANTDSLTDTDKAAQKALAEQYVQALQNKDLNAVNQLIDYEVYADNILKNLSLKDTKRNKRRLNRIKEQFIQWQKNYQKIYSNSDYITLIGWQETPKFSGYMVRFINSDYISFYFGIVPKKINNQWKIVDIYDPTKLDVMSHFGANAMNQMLFDKDSVLIEFLKDYSVIDIGKFSRFSQKVEQKQYVKAIEIYRSFSDELKREEVVLDMGLGMAAHFSDDETFYEELIEIVGTYHRDNPKYYSPLINYYVIKKEYDKARQGTKNSFASIDKAMMNFQLANISILEEDYPRAVKEAKQCAKVEPNLQPCYDMWINLADIMKNYDEEVLAYQTLSKNFGGNFTKSMFSEQEHGDFMRSDAFKNWDIPEK